MTRTDWRGTLIGAGVGLGGGAALVIWATVPFAWFTLSLAAVAIVAALLGPYVRWPILLPCTALILVAFSVGWLEFRDKVVGEPHGPHFEFSGIKNDGDGNLNVEVSNTSDIAATSYFLSGAVFPSSAPFDEHNQDIQNAIAETVKQATQQKLVPNDAMKITRGFGIGLPVRGLRLEDIAKATEQGVRYFVVLTAIYSNAPEPVRRMWATTVCARIVDIRQHDVRFEACHFHNSFYYADQNLNPVD